MKTKRFSRKSIIFLLAIAVFLCGVQNLSFGQVTLTASAPASLTEATLDGSVVTLTLQGGIFENNLRSPQDLVFLAHEITIGTIERLSDTQVRIGLQYNGNFDRDGTLTISLAQTGIQNYTGSTLDTEIPFTATTESLTATPTTLMDTTLHGSTVVLTLGGRTFEDDVNIIKRYTTVSGISGVTLGTMERLSDTQVRIGLQYNGNLGSRGTLIFRINEEGIKNYRCFLCTYTLHLTAEIPVSVDVVSLTATPTFLTEATLHESRVTLTLQGRIFKPNVTSLTGAVSVSGIPGVISLGLTRDSDTQITMRLFFNGDLDRNGALTFRVSQVGIQTPISSDLIAEIPVSAVKESLTATPTSLTEATLDGSRVTLTLHGRKFADNIEQYVTTPGLAGNTLRFADITRLSDTQITVPLEFHGDLNSDTTLTFWINQGGIPSYPHVLTTEVPISAGTTPVRTPQPPDLIISAIRASKVTLTPGEQFTLFATVENQGTGQSPTTTLQFQRSTHDFYTQIGTRSVSALSANRSVEVNFPLTAPVQEGVYHYRAYLQSVNYHSEWVTITVAAPATTPQGVAPQPNVVPTPQPNVVTTPNTNVISTPQPTVAPTAQPTVVRIPDANLRAAVQQVIGNQITTHTMLNLRYLYPNDLGISNLTGLEHATNLIQLRLQNNSISDISPLSRLTQLTSLSLGGNSISDISPLSRLTQLTDLSLWGNSISDISPLSRLTQLTDLSLWGNSISDISPLSGLTQLTILALDSNSISDISPLSGLTQLTDLSLQHNSISDISPLAGLTQLTGLYLSDNPLNDAALTTHIPAIQANGTEVEFDNRAPTTPQPQPNVVSTPQLTVVTIPDQNLRTAIQQEIGNTLTTNTMINLTYLDAYDLGIRDLTGLEHATNLNELYLWGNSISDVSPLAGLIRLTDLDLYDNNISDIVPLVGLTRLEFLSLEENPLNDAALTTHIPAIQANGTEVEFDDRTPTTPPPPSQNPIDTRTPTVPIDPSQPAIYLGGADGIQRANLDGSNVQTLVEGVYPSKLTLDAAGGKMYWINWESIQRANLDGSEIEILVNTLGTQGASEFELTLDVSGGKMYWRHSKWDAGTSKIRRANLNGSNVETLVESGFQKFFTLDVASGKMYWIDDVGIRRANLNGSNVETLVTGENGWQLTLDASSGKMYWADNVGIRRANLNGSNVETLVTGENGWQLTLDVLGGKIYWIGYVGETPSKIQRANLDGSNVETLVREEYTWQPTLDVARGKMYWIGEDAEGSKIRRANLDGSNVEDITTASIYVNVFALIPSQTPADEASSAVVSKKPEVDTQTKTVQVHIEATDRPPMYWIDTAVGTLHRLVDAEVENFVPSVQNATSLTVDVANGKLYWTEKTGGHRGRIRSANLDGTNAQLLRDLTSVPLNITLNAANGKLYWTNSWGKVQQLNVNGSGFRSNLITGLDTLTGLAIDVAAGTLYWTEKTGASSGSIRSANLDGTNVQLLRNLTSVPLDIDLDAADGKLYLMSSLGKVQRLNLDGSGFQSNFITGLDTIIDIAMDTAGQQLYVTSSDGKISRRDLSGGGFEEVVTGLGSPGGLVLGDAILDDQMDDTTPQTTADDTMDNAADVNNDGTVDDKDVSLVSDAISNGSTDAKYDVNNDGVVNHLDYVLVLGNRDRNPYDINNDGTVDDEDASLLTDAISNGATDDKYDVNDDGKVNFDDLQLVLDNRNPEAAGAPLMVGNLKLTAIQIARIQEQIELLIATGDRSPAAMRTLIYLQQFLAMARPEKTLLLANYPNPFNPETWIPYQLSTGSDVRITIYDVKGKVIRRLVLGHQSAGYYTARSRAAYWDGRNAVGEPVASGLYFYTFTARDFTATRRMLILK